MSTGTQGLYAMLTGILLLILQRVAMKNLKHTSMFWTTNYPAPSSSKLKLIRLYQSIWCYREQCEVDSQTSGNDVSCFPFKISLPPMQMILCLFESLRCGSAVTLDEWLAIIKEVVLFPCKSSFQSKPLLLSISNCMTTSRLNTQLSKYSKKSVFYVTISLWFYIYIL